MPTFNGTVGSAIEFQYDGGSHPGETRIVYITNIPHAGLIQGYCFNRQDIRNFSVADMSGIKFVSVSRLKTDVLPKDIAPIIKGFQADGKVAFHDPTRGEIVTYTPPSYTLSYIQGVMTLTGPKGSIRYNAVTGFIYGSNIITKRPTAKEFIEAVQSVG